MSLHIWINFVTCMSRCFPHVCCLFCKINPWWDFSSTYSFLQNLHLQNVLFRTKHCFWCCDLSGVPISCFWDAQLSAFVSEGVHVCPDGRVIFKNQDLLAERENVAKASMAEVTGQFPNLPFPSLKAWARSQGLTKDGSGITLCQSQDSLKVP